LAQVIAKHLSEEEIARLRGMFKAMDNGNNVVITLSELKEGLSKCGSVFRNIEISDIVEAVSNSMWSTSNHTGVYDVLTYLLKNLMTFQSTNGSNHTGAYDVSFLKLDDVSEY
jgi:Ca2+-binding EF-hand superfamily protein